jgi:hypothetical protein
VHHLDHEPGAWFLVEDASELFLDARYSYSAVIDDSALVRLDDVEVTSFRSGGRDYLSELARRIHDSAPYREESQYHRRDLYRGQDGARWRQAVSAAIVDHTWIAEQRRSTGEQ